MKIFTLALTLSLCSGSLFAKMKTSSAKDSWDQLGIASDVIILQPINLPINIFNACFSDDELQSIRPVKKCVGYDQEVVGNPTNEGGGYFQKTCTDSEKITLSFPRDHQENVCVKNATSEVSSNQCLVYETIDKSYPRKYKLDIVAASGEMALQHLFYKEFTIPDCP